jgi:predicted DNA-binding transcriptional regulator AlpA
MDDQTNIGFDHKLLVGMEEAAGMLDISRRELERRIAASEIARPVKIGRLSKMPVEDVVAYAEKLKSVRGEIELNTR